MANTLSGRDEQGVLTCLPDGGVTGSEFASACGVLMDAGVSCGGQDCGVIGRQAGGDASEPLSRRSRAKLRRRFTLMNSSFLPDTVLMKMFLMHEVIYECDRAGVVVIEFLIHSFTTQTNKYTP